MEPVPDCFLCDLDGVLSRAATKDERQTLLWQAFQNGRIWERRNEPHIQAPRLVVCGRCRQEGRYLE